MIEGPSKKPDKCAYCGGPGPFTREHVLPRWARRKLKGSEIFVPRREKHAWGGDPVVTDVCDTCNNVILGRLDERARDLLDALAGGASELQADQAVLLARWAAKVAYNSQRAKFGEGDRGLEPSIRVSVPAWIIGRSACPPEVEVCAARIPAPAHTDDIRAGIYSFGSTGLGLRYVALGNAVVYVAWDGGKVSARMIGEWLVVKVPSARLVNATEPVQIPHVGNPKIVHKGFYRKFGLDEPA